MSITKQHIPSGCVVYTKTLPDFILEGDISCKGDLDSVLLFFGEQISAIVGESDFSEFSSNCLSLTKDITVAELTRKKLEKICEHEKALEDIQDTLDSLNVGNQEIRIDLSCLISEVDPCNIGNIYTLSEVLLVFKKALCTLRDRINACCIGTQGSSGTSGGDGSDGTSGESGTAGTSGDTSGTSGTSGTDGSETQTISATAPCTGINSSYLIENTVPGDVIVVRATFSGIVQKLLNNFTRADLSISAPNGTSDFVSSPCYADTASHPFSITAETTITAISSSELVLLTAVVHNSSESATSVIVAIVNINGNDVNRSIPGCRGNSATGGTC